MAKDFKSDQEFEEKLGEWNTIEGFVMTYKSQFESGASEDTVKEAKDASEMLIKRFHPLFRKYIMLLKTGQIDFNSSDIKTFVSTFIDDPRLHRALKRTRSKAEYKSDIYKRFGFILETYGQLEENEMMIDMSTMLLVMAKRYKQMNRNFCAYVYNCFRYELSRHIKAFIKNPLNISYKNTAYEDAGNISNYDELNIMYEDAYYEPENGIPNMAWISGSTCSEVFNELTAVERKIIVKYYAEEYNDKQIAEQLGLHINTVNQKRRAAISKLAGRLDIDPKNVKRNRHSGKRKDS